MVTTIMMKLVSFCAAAVSLDDQIPAMEIETLLHSGSYDPFSSFMGVFVSKRKDVKEDDYLRVLKSEGEKQVFRFLTELGISQVEICGSESEFSVEEVKTPSRHDIEAIVEEMKIVLRNRDLPSNIVPVDMVLNLDFLKGVRRINAFRRFAENIFLLKRFEILIERLESRSDAGYVNQEKTQTEEMDAVFKQLFQKERPPSVLADGFDLRFLEMKMPSSVDMPLKLIVPHDKANVTLDFTLSPKAQLVIGQKRVHHLRNCVNGLQTRYERQNVAYASFANVKPFRLRIKKTSLHGGIRYVGQLRRRVLALYEKFRFPFPRASSPSFYIYIHDPECRGTYNQTFGRPFDTIADAVRFYRAVDRAFERMPEMLYSGLLQNVVLFQNVPKKRAVHGQVLLGGRHMRLFRNALPMLEEAIRYECGHVFDGKLRYRLRTKLESIVRSRYTHQVHKCLLLFKDAVALNLLPPNYDKNATILPSVFAAFRRVSLGGAQQEIVLSHEKLSTLQNEINKLDAHEWGFFKEMQDVEPLDEQQWREYHQFGGDLADFSMARGDLSEFTNVYANYNAAEEAAELVKQLSHSPARAGLFTECQFNSAKREKLTGALEILSTPQQGRGETQKDVRYRRAIVSGWELDLLLLTAATADRMGNLHGRYTVVLISKAGVDHVDMRIKADAFIERSILDGHRVSSLHLIQDSWRLKHCVLLQKSVDPFVSPRDRYRIKSDVVFFGVDATELMDAHQLLMDALSQRGLDLDGRPPLQNIGEINMLSDMGRVLHHGCGGLRAKFTLP